MAFKVGVGKSDFASLRKSGNSYVDKTELAFELVNDTDNEVTLFTRPRRFGKTLMLSMMKDSKSIFEGLAITEHEDFCKEWMNKYPVLFVSFKDVEAEEFDGAYKMLKTKLADLCKDVAPILDNAAVDKDDKEIILKLKAKKAGEDEVKSSLKTIMRMMNAVYGKQVTMARSDRTGNRKKRGQGQKPRTPQRVSSNDDEMKVAVPCWHVFSQNIGEMDSRGWGRS